MTRDLLDQRIGAVGLRVQALRESVAWEGPSQAVGGELEALASAVEEMAVMAEELAQANDELAQAQQAIAAERARFHALFDLTPIAHVATDESGMIQEANQAAVELFERPRERLVGLPLVVLVVSRDRPSVLRALESTSSPGRTELVVTLRRRTIPPRRAALVAAAHRQPHSSRVVQWAVRDVTADEGAMAALERALAQERETLDGLQVLGELRDVFLTAVAHDLRAPLAALLGLVDVLRLGGAVEEEQRGTLLDGIHQTATEMSGLVVDLLDLTRSEHGVMPFDPTEADVSATVQRAAERAVAMGRGRGPPVELDLRSVVACVDHRLVERIAANLVANAQQHIPAQGHVWVRLRREPDGVLLIVEDDGPGVPDEHKSNVFELFRRGPNSPSLGIGLQLVQRFTALHGGWTKVEDRAGGGASFHVLIPESPQH